MTVKEHLIFYGKLKENMGKKELKRDINEYKFHTLSFNHN